jgi:hypothetical protein
MPDRGPVRGRSVRWANPVTLADGIAGDAIAAQSYAVGSRLERPARVQLLR